MIVTVEKDQADKSSTVKSLIAELAKVEKASQKHREEARRKSSAAAASGDVVLSEDDLQEYTRLKGLSARKAVKERQELEGLEREMRTKNTELDGARDKLEQADFKIEKAKGDEKILDERNGKVRQIALCMTISRRLIDNSGYHGTQLSERSKTLEEDIKRIKKELVDFQAEKSRIK